MRDGLIAEYLFAGDSRDTSGRAHHGVVRGAVLTSDRFGNPDAAYQFDGIDDEILIDPPPPLSPEGFSVSVWARFDRHPMHGWSNCIVAQDDGNDDRPAKRVFQLSADNRHVVWHRMIQARDPQCKQWVRFGEWYHFVATYANRRHTLYLDGVAHDSVEDGFVTNDDQPLHIGRKGSGETFFFFRGAIDDVRLYDRALPVDEVRTLFRESGFDKPQRIPGTRHRDPISGRWGQRGINILDLALHHDGSVTGNVMAGRPGNRADITSGEFDPATGWLRLAGVARHLKTGEQHDYVVTGMLDEHLLTVTATFGGWSGNRTLSKNGARWPWRYSLARRLNRLIERVLGLRRFDEE